MTQRSVETDKSSDMSSKRWLVKVYGEIFCYESYVEFGTGFNNYDLFDFIMTDSPQLSSFRFCMKPYDTVRMG